MLLIHYWELLLECPDVLDQTHIDGLNQIDASLDLLPLAKNQLNTLAYSWEVAKSLFQIIIGMPGHAWPDPFTKISLIC